MSVNEHHYVIHGIKLKYKDYQTRYNIDDNDDIHDAYNGMSANADPDMVVVADGMSGEYVIIGKQLVKSDYEGIRMTTLKIDDLDIALLKSQLMGKFGITEDELELSLKPEVYIFTHYH